MAAVIRIKRHLNEDPLDAILLNCKRRKTEDSTDQNAEDLSAVLKFAGTVHNPEEDIFKHFKKPTKAESEGQYKKHTSDIVAKLRQQKELASKKNRFKVVNSFRSCHSAEESSKADANCTVVDIEANENKDNASDATKSDDSHPKFVYDLYYTNSDDFGEADLNELISVYPLSEGLVYGPQRGGYNDSDSEYSEDSNAENNWKNDYPDESDVESDKDPDDDSITEDDMLSAMHKVNLKGGDLSSDEYDEAFLYDRDDDYNQMYAKYKNKYQNNFCCSSNDD